MSTHCKFDGHAYRHLLAGRPQLLEGGCDCHVRQGRVARAPQVLERESLALEHLLVETSQPAVMGVRVV